MTIKNSHVDAIPIVEALGKFLEFLKKFDSVILIAHNVEYLTLGFCLMLLVELKCVKCF